jgi:hypothetical protein
MPTFSRIDVEITLKLDILIIQIGIGGRVKRLPCGHLHGWMSLERILNPNLREERADACFDSISGHRRV